MKERKIKEVSYKKRVKLLQRGKIKGRKRVQKTEKLLKISKLSS